MGAWWHGKCHAERCLDRFYLILHASFVRDSGTTVANGQRVRAGRACISGDASECG